MTLQISATSPRRRRQPCAKPDGRPPVLRACARDGSSRPLQDYALSFELEKIGLYEFGALDKEEQRAFLDHLIECEYCYARSMPICGVRKP